MQNRLKVFIKYPNKKSVFTILKEVIILAIKKREIPYYYFKFLYRKDAKNFLEHLSLKEQQKLQTHKKLHNPALTNAVNNKLFFALMSRLNNIKTPKLIGHNFYNSFFYNGQLLNLSTLTSAIKTFERIFNTENIEAIFVRPPADYGGRGCFKITAKNYKEELKEKYHNTIVNGNFVFTEIIKQHELINKIHSNSLNTLRIITVITQEGTTKIVAAIIRFGVGNSIVDNSASGGFFVGININDGTLQKHGYYFPEYGGHLITKHPDSNITFEGFKIPYFKEACNTVINAVNYFPDRLIGWDIAITPNGPVIIEANTSPHLQSMNMITNGFLQNKHIKSLLHEVN